MKSARRILYAILIGVITFIFPQINADADDIVPVNGDVKKIVPAGEGNIEFETTKIGAIENGIELYCSLTNNTDNNYALYKDNYYILDSDKHDYPAYINPNNNDNEIVVRPGAKNEVTFKFKGVDIDKGPFILKGKVNQNKSPVFGILSEGTDITLTFNKY